MPPHLPLSNHSLRHNTFFDKYHANQCASHRLGQGLIDRTYSNKPTFHIHQNGLYGGCTALISPPSATLMSSCTHIISLVQVK